MIYILAIYDQDDPGSEYVEYKHFVALYIFVGLCALLTSVVIALNVRLIKMRAINN